MSPMGEGGQKTTGPGDSTIIYLLIKKQPLQHLEKPRRTLQEQEASDFPYVQETNANVHQKAHQVERPPEQTQPEDSKLTLRRLACSSGSPPPEGRPTSCKLTFSAFSRRPGLQAGGQPSEFEKWRAAVCPCAACCSSCVHASVVKQTHGALQACLHKQVFQLKANVSCVCEAPFLRCSSGVPQVFLRRSREHSNVADPRSREQTGPTVPG